MEGLLERFGRPSHISEMDVSNPTSKAMDRRGYIASHGRKRSQAETNRIAGRIKPLEQPIKTLDIVHDPWLFQ
jgi:hypothetical protein